MTFIKTDSGTTNIVFWAGATSTSGVSIETVTGVTASSFDVDAPGDSLTFLPSYSNQIYYIISDRIH